MKMIGTFSSMDPSMFSTYRCDMRTFVRRRSSRDVLVNLDLLQTQPRVPVVTTIFTGDYRGIENNVFAAYVMRRNDHAGKDGKPLTYGLRAYGRPTSRLTCWSEFALLRGSDESGQQFSARAMNFALRLTLGGMPGLCFASGAYAVEKAAWQDDFGVESCNILSTGRTDYFVLEPGWRLVLKAGSVRMQITVLDETKTVGNVTARVVEEREWNHGMLQEVARNYYGICESTKDLLHFGEDVDIYKKGKLVSQKGTWLASATGNKPGLLVPGSPKLKMKYYEEIAPGVTLNRGEVISMTETCRVPAGTFKP